VALILSFARRIAVGLSIEAIGRYLAVNVETLREQLPQFFMAGSAREPPGHADDSDFVILGSTFGLLGFNGPGQMIPQRYRSLTSCLERGSQAVGDISCTDSDDIAFSVAESGNLRDTLLEEIVPSYRLE
jgi:hypothetical protein